MKKLLLYSLNFGPELTGIGKYNNEMVAELKSYSIQIDVLTAPPYYPEWKRRSGYSYLNYSTEIVNSNRVVRCPIYIPSKVTTFKRLLHLISFAVSSGLKLLLLIRNRPDVVFLVQPTFFCAPITLLFCKLTGAKSIMHIQDYELDAMLGLGMGSDNFVTSILKKFEKFILGRFDIISTISHSMITKATEKGVDRSNIVFFPNWADINQVTPLTCGKDFKSNLGYSHTDKIVLYAGNIGKKQGLEIVLDAAEVFKEQRHIQFLLVGAGAQVAELKELAKLKGLSNLKFLPLQRWEDVPAMLAMADVHLVIQKRGAADVVLPSKLTNILAAGGNAIVTAEESTELGALARMYPGIYSLIEPENTQALVVEINKILGSKVKLGHNTIARKYAEENLDRNVIIKRFLSELKERLE